MFRLSIILIILSVGCAVQQKVKASTSDNKVVVRIPSAKSSEAENLWSSFRNGFQNQANHHLEVRDLVNTQSNRAVKAISTGGLFWGTAVIDEKDNFYVGSSNKFFYSFDKNGKMRWKFQIYDRADSLIDSAAVLAKNKLVVVPGGDGFLHALNRDTGEQVWDFKAHGTSDESHQKGTTVNSFEGNVQLGLNNNLYAGNDNGYLYAVSPEGSEIWSFKTNMMIWSSPAFDPNGKWMVFGSLDGHLYVLNPKTGALIDKVKIGFDIKSSPSIDKYGNIYFGCSNFIFYSYKLVDNKLVKNWEYSGAHGELYSSAAVKDNSVVFGSLEGAVYNLSTSGKLNWKFMTYSPVASSPLITKDNVVLFGAKNGKFYSLDLESGERIWSFKTTDANQKSNLDASASLNSTGIIINGSYRGIVHQIPFEYCLQNKQDERCEFGDKNDSPNFGRKLDKDASTLVYFNPQGKFEVNPQSKIGLTEILKLQLVVLENSVWKIDRAINTSNIKVNISPRIKLQTEVSSDGQFLNILPLESFQPNQEYTIDISGTHYAQKTWIKDRLNYFGHEKFEASLKFTTTDKGLTDNEVLKEGALGIRSMYLQQPQALDTYTPAALDGQGFLAKPFGFNSRDNSFLLYVIPALPRVDDMIPIAEASKTFIMQGFLDGNHLRTSGKVKLSAMGGTIDFSYMTLRGQLPKFEGFYRNTFYSETSCLSIKGNGSGYSFPMKLVNRICGPSLNMKAVGELDLVHYTKNNNPQMFENSYAEVSYDKNFNLSVSFAKKLDTPKIVTYIVYQKNDGTVDTKKTEITTDTTTVIEFGKIKLSKGQFLIVFVNQNIVFEKSF